MLIHCRFFGKSVLGLIQAFCFNWLYFEIGKVPSQSEKLNQETNLKS